MENNMWKRKLLMTASVQRHIRNFHLPYLKEFKRLGWETHIACAENDKELPYIDRTIVLPFKKKTGSISNFEASRILRSIIRREKYDLIITHTSLAAFFTRLATKGIKARPPLINVMHGYLFDDETQPVKRTLLLQAERFTSSETDLLLTMNKWDFDLAQRYKLGKKIEMIPGMGVDFSRLDQATEQDGKQLRKKLSVPENAFVLIYAAEFSAGKSQRVLIEAMRYLPDNTWLVLPGEGELQKACREVAQDYGLINRILFPGQVADMPCWYRMANAAVSASRKEGLPFNILEAMHMGLPVVASEIKGHTDLIRDGETGFLYPYGDAKSCAAAVSRTMNNNEEIIRIKKQAKEYVSRYGADQVIPIVMKKYLSLQLQDQTSEVIYPG